MTMILTAFSLERDPLTEGHSLGYERPLWSRCSPPYTHNSPNVGCPIEIETKLKTRLVKIVELYRRGEVIIAERLAWMFDSDIYPFRVKYIRTNEELSDEEPVLFLPNMGKIHKKLTGIDVTFSSPLRYYMDNVEFNGLRNPLTREYVQSICDIHHLPIDGTALQEVDSKSLKDFMMMLDTERPYGTERFVIPRFMISEPVSHLFVDRPMRARDITLSRSTDNPFDTSSVGALPINNPDVTVYSQKVYHRVAETCKLITNEYTDVKFEYILSNGRIQDRRFCHLINRYHKRINPALVVHLCDWVVIDAASISGVCDIRVGEGMFVTVEITYGDEVLIEIYSLERRKCLIAIHLDLAMIALCASDVVALSA